MIELIRQLKDKKSAKRRSAAKKLGKLGDVEAGPHLLEALQNELEDVRTWETQYQMVMAIGKCEYKEALPFIKEIAGRKFEATSVYTAIGDVLVRLSIGTENDVKPVIDLFSSKNDHLINGGLRAMAMLRMVPSNEQILSIIKYVSSYSLDEGIRFWVIAAAAGWSGSEVDAFLVQSDMSTRDDFKIAIQLARKKKYKKWQPL